jgi:hypothetical protein
MIRADSQLPKPLWLLSTELPSGRIVASVIPHSKFTEMVTPHVKQVHISESALMSARDQLDRGGSRSAGRQDHGQAITADTDTDADAASAVNSLFSELGFTVSESDT